MTADISLAQELELERACRAIMSEPNVDGIRKLCGSLIKTHYRHQKLLEKATLRISELEILAFLLSEAKETDLVTLRDNAREML
jgi:hypothetical protein